MSAADESTTLYALEHDEFERFAALLEIARSLDRDEAFTELRLELAAMDDTPLRRWAVSETSRLLGLSVRTALSDLDDPPPATLLANGFDVVLLFETRFPIVAGDEVVIRVHSHPRLGLTPQPPFRARFTGTDWEAA